MRPINVAGFTGSNQALPPRALAESVGVMALDLDPGFGEFRPLYANLAVATVPSGRKGIYRMGRDVANEALYWLTATAFTSWSTGFDAEDTTERTYFITPGSSPKWTSNAIAIGAAPYPQATRELAVPAPIAALTATLDTDGSSGTDGTRFYVHTFINELGWESAPSPPSTGVVTKPGATLDLTNMEAAPAGAYGITGRRIYRTQPGVTDATEYFFLREVAIGTTSTTDDARALGAQLETEGWIPPPSGARSFKALWGGMYAVATDRAVHLSPVEVPYAFPLRYDLPVRDKIVTLATWGQNLLALTVGKPVLFQGSDPESMLDTPFPVAHACRSAAGVVSFEHGVVWPSSEGLAYSGTTELLTEKILTPRQWKALKPDTMVAGRWGRFYVCSYTLDGGTTYKGFMIDPANPGAGITYLSAGFSACHYDELLDELYVLVGTSIQRFNGHASTRLPASFTSRQFLQPRPVNYGFCKVQSDSYPVDVTITARGFDAAGTPFTKVQERTVTGPAAFTLEDGFAAEDWQVTVESAVDVQIVRLATSVDDFKGA